jgi:hypothetical protein
VGRSSNPGGRSTSRDTLFPIVHIGFIKDLGTFRAVKFDASHGPVSDPSRVEQILSPLKTAFSNQSFEIETCASLHSESQDITPWAVESSLFQI